MIDNKSRGFVTIPNILIIFIVGGLVVGSTGTVAYKVGQRTDKKTEEVKIEKSTINVKEELGTDIEVKDESEVENEKNIQQSEIEKLRKEITTLNKTISVQEREIIEAEVVEQVNKNIVTLPNGAIVEMSANGEIINYIKYPESPEYKISTETPTQNQDEIMSNEIDINNVHVATGITTGRLEWVTSKPSTSKVFISSSSMLEKVFDSSSGLSTKHYVDLIGFNIKADSVYFYEVEAIDASGDNFAKANGTFKLLPKSYAEIAPPIKIRADYNTELSCKELFGIFYEYLICLDYRAGI